jgi:hypothetical protein
MRHTARLIAVTIALAATFVGNLARAEDVKLPETAAEHMAMSKEYLEKAATWRAEAQLHKEMAAEYRKSHPDRKSGARNPWTVKMEEHCAALVRDARAAATDAEDLAKFHRHRALELEGK